MMTIRRAVPGDQQTVLAILHSVARWLHRQGYDQWPEGSPSLGPVAVRRQLEHGDFWIVSDDRDPVAVMALSRFGDIDFWSPAELDEPAVYVSKAAVLRHAAGYGVGAAMLRWACDRAASQGAAWVRLDVWKTNTGLQDYYRRQGWQYHGTVEAEGRNSGALFCRRAKPDPAARAAFTVIRTASDGDCPVEEGMPVIVPTDAGPVAALCTQVTADGSAGITGGDWESGPGEGPPLYRVERDGRTWLARDVWTDPAAGAAATGLQESA